MPPQQFPLIFGPFSVLYSMYFFFLLRKIKIYPITCTTFLNVQFPKLHSIKKLSKNPFSLTTQLTFQVAVHIQDPIPTLLPSCQDY